MKNTRSILLLLLGILFFPGCQKEIKEEPAITSESEVESWDHHGRDKGSCRLVSNTSEFAEHSYSYNNRGLVDQWNVSWLGGYLKMEYDFRGRLIKSKLYSNDGVLWSTIIFRYERHRVVKETWYDGDSDVKTDETFYYYNRDGKVWKSQSIINDYISYYKYTSDGGSVKEWKFYLDGKLNYVQQFTYLPPHHKMPDRARPGLDYDFIGVNGWWNAGRWYSTSEKDISYDENGEKPVIVLDQDPYKSVIRFNRQNYVTATDFYDKLTQEYVHFRFEYENCGHDHHGGYNNNDHLRPSLNAPGNDSRVSLPKFLMMKKGAGQSIKEQITEYRKKLKDSILK